VVGLGKIDQLKVEGEGARQLVGRRRVGGEGVGEVAGVIELAARSIAVGVGFAAGDGSAAQRLHGVKERVAGLLPQHLAQQRGQRADVAAQRSLFGLAGAGLEFGEPAGPAWRSPKRRHM